MMYQNNQITIAGLEQAEDGLYEDFERELIDLDLLISELEEISLLRSTILKTNVLK